MENVVTLKSGAMLELKMAPFSSGTKLWKVIVNELKAVEFDLSDVAGKDVNSLKNAIFQLLGSDALEACFFDCAKLSMHNGKPITRGTFEPDEARGDYLPSAWEVIKFNVAPFLSGLDLSSLTSVKVTPKGQ